MARNIGSVAVMGSGTMGAGIAALCASRGARVLLLDMPAKEGDRNAIAKAARERMAQQKLLEPAQAQAVEVGNFEDDLARVGEADLIVEAIVENVSAKRALFEKLEKVRRDGSIVTTNTSGIRLAEITAGMPKRLRQDVAVTHFFNPVKVMRLVELVPGEDTSGEVVETLAAYLSKGLGKGVVWGKDTVNFIANRIGCFWMLAGLNENAGAFGELSVEQVDALMGQPVGAPPTALYGLCDLVGLDVLGLVAKNLSANLPARDAGRKYAQLPPVAQKMLERGQVGRKAGGGFYRMTTGADGQKLKETFDLASETWRPSQVVKLDEAHATLQGALMAEDALGRFGWTVMGGTLLYAADLVPEISDDIVNVDRAMRWGFAWRQGPFEMLDAVGPGKVAERLEREGRPLPAMLKVLRQAKAETFYRDGGKRFLGRDGQWRDTPPE
jgi:3-hydroxyacyl-CoA dehydrogenase